MKHEVEKNLPYTETNFFAKDNHGINIYILDYANDTERVFNKKILSRVVVVDL